MLISIILNILVFVIVYKLIWATLAGAKHHFSDIPGPSLIMLVGNIIQMLKPTTGPEESFNLQRRYGLKYFPIYKVWNFRHNIICLMHPEDIKMVLNSDKCIQDKRFFNDWFGISLLTTNGETWRHKRKLLNPCFAYSSMPKFVDTFKRKSKMLVEDIEQNVNRPVGISKIVGVYTIGCIHETLLGASAKSSVTALKYIEAVDHLLHIFDYKVLRPWFFIESIYKMTALSKEEREVTDLLREYPRHSIDTRDPTENLDPSERGAATVDKLLEADFDGKISEHINIHDEINGLMAAGYNTLKESLSFLLMLLANHPEVQNRLLQEINETLVDEEEPSFQQLQTLSYMEACINESLRIYPNISTIPRKTTGEIKLYTGHIIPKDTILLLQLYDMHHNPQLHSNPKKFDPDRFLPGNKTDMKKYSHQPFGAGPRRCIGQKFAVLEIKTALCYILRKFTLEPIDNQNTVNLLGNFFMKTRNEIRIQFKPR